MADTKITALAAITTVDPAADVLPIVDISDTSMAASGTTKKITSNQILGAGGTATLASATITGDLTVDTNVLKVDSANNRVGIGTASPGALIEAYTNTNGQNRVFINNPSTGSSAYNSIDFTGGTAGNQILSMGSGYSGSFPYTTGALLLRSGQVNGMVLSTGGSAAPIVFGINDSEAMRLNSTGLGVGVTPSGTGGCLQLKSGITFPATQVASSDANTLDDYVEATFSPTVIGSTSAGTATYSIQLGRYTKIGRLVTFSLRVSYSGGTGTGNLKIGGLPTAGFGSNFAIYAENIALTASYYPVASISATSSQIGIDQLPTGGGAAAAVPYDAAGDIQISGSYIV
jgi:hypothetical protein